MPLDERAMVQQGQRIGVPAADGVCYVGYDAPEPGLLVRTPGYLPLSMLRAYVRELERRHAEAAKGAANGAGRNGTRVSRRR